MTMKLEKIISISGMPGLYKMVGQMKNGIVVESLEDGKRFPAFATHKISALEDISIYGQDEDIPLGEVFDKLHEKTGGAHALDPKSPGNEIRAYFEDFLPDYDEDRVYQTDMKKVLKWYNLLLDKDLLLPDDEEEEEGAETAAEGETAEAEQPEAEVVEEEEKPAAEDEADNAEEQPEEDPEA